MKYKKILFIAPINTKGRYSGGIVTYATTILSDVFFNNGGIVFEPLSNCLVERDSYSGGKFAIQNIINFIKLRREIKKKLQAGEIDSIYINSSRRLALLKDLFLINKKFSKKYEIIFHIHFANFDEVMPKQRLLRKIALRRIRTLLTKIILLSTNLKKDMAINGVPEGRMFVLYNYFSPSLASITKTDKNENSVNYLFVGNITNRKGIYSLLDVFSTLDNSYNLTVCGTPDEVDGENAVEKYKQRKNIQFLGFVKNEQKNYAFANADVFVLPTLAEGLPISILEAFYFGLGVITTPVGAIPEIVTQKNGLLVNPGNHSELREAIIKYHDNPELLGLHKRNNRIESDKYSYYSFRVKLLNILRDNE